MTDRDIQSVSAATGQFPALTRVPKVAPGSKLPDNGKELPRPKAEQPDLQKLIEKLKKASQSNGRDLKFEVSLDSKRAVISVLDRETGEIIRQIPPEKAEVYMADDGDLALRLFDASV